MFRKKKTSEEQQSSKSHMKRKLVALMIPVVQTAVQKGIQKWNEMSEDEKAAKKEQVIQKIGELQTKAKQTKTKVKNKTEKSKTTIKKKNK